LQNGDEIIVDFDGITYKYVVTDKFEVKPEDVYILEQRYDNKELKLVTCVPEGTFLRRGVIVAQLVDFAN
jgi:sortase A